MEVLYVIDLYNFQRKKYKKYLNTHTHTLYILFRDQKSILCKGIKRNPP